MTSQLTVCCDVPYELAPDTNHPLHICSRCGQVYREKELIETNWFFPKYDSHGERIEPLHPGRLAHE